MRVHKPADSTEFKAAEDPPIPAGVTSELASQLARDAQAFVPPRGVSVSQINVWRDCPRRWAFRWRSHLQEPQELPADADPKHPPQASKSEIGIALHAVLEAAARVRIDGHVLDSPKAGKRELTKYLAHLTDAMGWHKLLYDAVLEAIKLVAPIDMTHVKAAELEATVNLGSKDNPVVVAAVLDRVDIEDQFTVIGDYKSGVLRRKFELELAPQTFIYFAIGREMWPGRALKMRYYFLLERAVVEIPYDDELMGYGIMEVRRIVRDMQNPDLALKATTGDHCAGCPYVLRCKEGSRWVAQSLLGPTPREGASPFELAVADALAEDKTNEELAAWFHRAKTLQDSAGSIKSAVASEIRKRLGNGQRNWGAWKAKIGRRPLTGFHWTALEKTPTLMGVDVYEFVVRTNGLERKATLAYCKNNQFALNELKRHESLDTATWVEVREKDGGDA